MEDMHEVTEWVDGWPVSFAAVALPAFHLPAPTACAVPQCGGAARFRLNRRAACGPECLRLLLRSIVGSHEPAGEAAAGTDAAVRPLLGHILVEQGSITDAQLAEALASQQATGAGRLGCWLKQHMRLRDADLTAALALQWRCPPLRVGSFAPATMAAYLPRPLMERHGALPLRVTVMPDRLSLCFEDHQSPALLRAVEQMHGMEVEAGLLTAPEFWRATRELLAVRFPRVKTLDASSPEIMVEAMGRLLALPSVAEARLVDIEGCYWLRMWTAAEDASCAPDGDAPQLEMCDVLCTLRSRAHLDREEFSAGAADALFRAMREAFA